jgi:hypothetical protein
MGINKRSSYRARGKMIQITTVLLKVESQQGVVNELLVCKEWYRTAMLFILTDKFGLSHSVI